MNSDNQANNQTNAPGRRDPMLGVVLDERFEIKALLGSGGMSNVYRATQLRVNRDVAIKTLKVQVDSQPAYRERFQREVDLLCALSHPNIVTVYDCLIGPDGQPCVVMDYLRGRSLEQLLIDEGPLSIDRFARIFVQVLGALDYAHRKTVVHRDIKPGNIVMLDNETDYVKVVDFGLAKFSQETRRLTNTGELWGSPPYMSPEQCMGKTDNEGSDIYSVGVVMYEMLTGKDPFHTATTIYELIQCHAHTPPPAMRDTNPTVQIPLELEQVILKAMAKDPTQRYRTANELKEALVSVCARHVEISASGAQRMAEGDSPWIIPPPSVNQYAAESAPSEDSPWRRPQEASAGYAPQPQDSPWRNPQSDSGWKPVPEDKTSQPDFQNNSFGEEERTVSSQQMETCPQCGKPVQKQRRGSMTAWILADHHKVMEQISGFCNCQRDISGRLIDTAQPQAASYPGASQQITKPHRDATSVQMANMLARQTGPLSGMNSESQSMRRDTVQHDQLFGDENRSGVKSAIRYNQQVEMPKPFWSNQIFVLIGTLFIVGGLVFGAIMFITNFSRETSTVSSTTTVPAKTNTVTESKPQSTVVDKESKADDDQPAEKKRPVKKRPRQRPQPAVTRTVRNSSPAPKAKPKPAASHDVWNDLQSVR